jgi:hypothetical protein
MKLAEALILRADHQKRLAQLKTRVQRVAKIQEGDQPAEDPQALLAEFERMADELTDLIQRINRTNAVTQLDDRQSLSDALAVRDMLATRHAAYRELAAAATIEIARYMRTEVKFLSTVDPGALQRQADDAARRHRELDARIQQANWLTELIER